MEIPLKTEKEENCSMIQQPHPWAQPENTYLENIHDVTYNGQDTNAQPMCPLNVDIYAVEYYSATQKDDEGMPVTCGKQMDCIVLRQEVKYHMISPVCGI